MVSFSYFTKYIVVSCYQCNEAVDHYVIEINNLMLRKGSRGGSNFACWVSNIFDYLKTE